MNEIRSQQGQDPLGSDVTVASVARAHSEDMADRDYFAHTNPDGEQPWDRYGDVADSPCRTFGENIAMVTVGPDATEDSVANRVVDMWMDSSGHRQNILSAAWNEEGIGVYVTDGGEVYVTQNFCG
ncbi:CAP domain-containing protein [Halobacterium litoreum]|uniref:CAP domain-containing protein n=1 Tax=Halobacterium litoreum TaxID=2039234 RepID=A0ABD5NG66_9EURY|nr:CAP domain-containing protein [Halobacterium litoreum]UHH12951.1 CAP domain-containing protein [Halobacterium litoreum]